MKPVELTDDTFKTFLKNCPTPLIVDFWAPWCGPCRMLTPVIEQLASESNGKDYVIAKVNVDTAPETSREYGIRSIPALVYFQNGEFVGQSIGVQTGAQILAKLKEIQG
jgi:thioredoxin 1